MCLQEKYIYVPPLYGLDQGVYRSTSIHYIYPGLDARKNLTTMKMDLKFFCEKETILRK